MMTFLKILFKVLIGLIALFYLLISGFSICLRFTHFNKKERGYIDFQGLGDTTVFWSNFENKDTLEISDVWIQDSYEIFTHETTLSEATGGYNYVKPSDRNWDASFAIMKNYSDKKIYYRSHCDKLVSCSMENFGYTQRLIASPFSIGSTKYEDCIIVDKSNGHLSPYANSDVPQICKYVISLSKGLIYYEYDSGEKFTRIDLLNENDTPSN